jgi:catechol 2,3-dioxygenase
MQMYSQIRLEGPILRVIDLDVELAYYQKFGMIPIRRFLGEGGHEMIELGFDANTTLGSQIDNLPILTLMHDPNASRPRHGSAGLFHFAILTPNRESLAATFVSLEKQGIQFVGFADHLVSESLYLQDPEDNGIEIYCDRPREVWQFDEHGHVQMDTLALNFQSLLSELYRDDDDDDDDDDDTIMNESSNKESMTFLRGAIIGHMHLKVTNLAASTNFYHEMLGFDLMQTMPGASFLSIEGYHHRLALNTWLSRAGISHKDGESGLEQFTVHFTDKASYKRLLPRISKSSLHTAINKVMVMDPDGIKMALVCDDQ